MKAFRSLILFCCVTVTAHAQSGLEELLRSGSQDASKLIQGYSEPVLKSLAFGLNQGWYNTAKPHSLLGFDLTFTGSAIFIPDDELFYNVAGLNLQNIDLVNPTDGQAPTIYGPDITPRYAYKAAPGVQFDGPPGIDPPKAFGRNIFPAPIAHLGIGLIKGTDVRIRFLPEVGFGDGNSAKLLGFGVMHDVKQYIPGIKALPFDLSLFAAYTKMEARVNLEGTFASNGTEQFGQYDVSAWTVQALISKKIAVLTVYGGVGYNAASTGLDIKGSYEIGSTPIGNLTLVDPVAISLSESSFRATGGLRLKLAVFTLHADYTLQKRSIFSAGFGISVR